MTDFFMKKIEVEARQFRNTIESANEILTWLGIHAVPALRVSKTDVSKGIKLKTLMGWAVVNTAGCWIIKQNDEDFYPCSDAVFQQNYRVVPKTWLDRVKLEQAELQIKLDALNTTMNVERKPEFISDEQWILMTRQQFHMRQYNNILLQRIKDAEQPQISEEMTGETWTAQGSEQD